jgi:hypothetical protein
MGERGVNYWHSIGEGENIFFREENLDILAKPKVLKFSKYDHFCPLSKVGRKG